MLSNVYTLPEMQISNREVRSTWSAVPGFPGLPGAPRDASLLPETLGYPTWRLIRRLLGNGLVFSCALRLTCRWLSSPQTLPLPCRHLFSLHWERKDLKRGNAVCEGRV